jgi:protein-tyrosine-phosphatase
VAESDLIFTMGPHHLERVEAFGARDRAYLLTGYPTHGPSGRAISDPMGGDLDVYRATADELESEIRRVFDRLAASQVPGGS